MTPGRGWWRSAPGRSRRWPSWTCDLGGAYPGREIARSLVELSRAAGELEAVDIVLRDVHRGLIDFPALRDGEEVYLCWLVDEEETIGFWHEPEAGFGGRRPL